MADTNVEIQGLEFKIKEDSTAAVAGLDSLIKTLDRLKKATQGGVDGLGKTASNLDRLNKALTGLGKNCASNVSAIERTTIALKKLSSVQMTGNFSKHMGSLSRSVAKFSTVNTDKVESVTAALKPIAALNGLKDVRISSTLAKQITAVNEAAKGVDWTAGDKLTALANGMRPLSMLGKAQLTTYINQLKKLPEVVNALRGVNLDRFTRKMKQLSEAMKPFADEMFKVSQGFQAFPARIQRLITSTERYNGVVSRASESTRKFNLVSRGLTFGAMYLGVRRLSSMVGTAITKSNEYQENLNLFTVAMGEYANEAYEYGQKVSEVLGIDLSDWIRNQGVFNTLLTGFGDTADRAALMSKNLTQLGYDLASFFNISVADSMQKLQSGISGELEPLRRLGYDLSQARLEATALSLGIDKSVSSMTQAEKAELRYYAIMTQVTTAQGDMARTLESPANQLRILESQLNMAARAIGNIFIPALNAILPYAIAVTKAIREIANAIASLFGFKMTEVDYSGVQQMGNAAGDVATGMGDAAKAAKKLKQYTAGFDELNVFAPNTGGTGAGGIGGGGNGFDFKLPEYDMLKDAMDNRIDAISKKIEPLVSWIKDHMKDILDTVLTIGAAMLAWKVSKALMSALEMLKNLVSKNLMFNIGFKVTGLSMLLSDMNEFVRYLEDFRENGATFQNVGGMLSEFAGMVGDFAIIMGGIKLGAAFKIIQGVGEIVISIKNMCDVGVNWTDALTVVRGLSNIAIGIGFLTGNIKLIGGGLILQGFTGIIRELVENWEAIKQGDWSGVDKATLIIGAIEVISGVAVALGAFGKLKDIAGVTTAATTVGEVATATGNVSDVVKNRLTPKLKDLAINLGIGIIIVGEVSVAALLAVGAIALMGDELSHMAESWKPVIDNGGTVTTAMLIGTGIIVGVGAAAYGLGTLGMPVAGQIGMGVAILVETGIAAGVFVTEIEKIGEHLEKIGIAWEPVINNGGRITESILIGTGLLVGIGTVTAALGGITIASGVLLPAAIGIGTAMLVGLSEAVILFVDELAKVADQLNNRLAPSLRGLNDTLPQLTTDMSDFTTFMGDFAGKVSDYTGSMGGITWDSIVGKFQKIFAGSPIQDLADDVSDIYTDTVNLNTELRLANPELEDAVSLLTSYTDLLSRLKVLTDEGGTVELSTGIFVNLKECGVQLVTGFAVGMDTAMPLVASSVNRLKTTLSSHFTDVCNAVNGIWMTNLNAMNSEFITFTVKINGNLITFQSNFQSAWTIMWRQVSNILVTEWNGMIRIIEKGMNEAIRAVNKVIDEINRKSHFTGIHLNNVDYITLNPIEYRAQGGFVDEGQLFIAREAGAEMVGSIGKHTAVANNDQIVEGISAGVTVANDGVIAAIYNLISAVESKDMSVSIGDDEIGRSYDRYNDNRGVRVSSGAFANAY